MLTNILLFLFLLAVLVQCCYVCFLFVRIFFLKTDKSISAATQPVSIIICARNEANNLRQNLPAILTQKYHNQAGYPLYEIVVVNDASDDDTISVLQGFQAEYPNLQVISINVDTNRTLPGKKFALSHGVAAAKHDWLLMTDADCVPASSEWLANMVQPLGQGRAIVAGYGGYHYGSGLLNAFTRWETVHTFLQYSTYALAGIPYMGVGRNLACTRQVLMAAQQSEVWGSLPSGDDDFLVNISGHKHNTGIAAAAASFTYSAAKSSWREWTAQKQRHLSTGKYYKPLLIVLLGFYACSHALMWLTFLLLLCTALWKTALYITGIRCLLYWAILAYTAGRLKEKKLIPFIPLFDFGWMIYNFAFAPYVLWKNKRQWK